MNILQRWIKALRSGEYNQTQGKLKRITDDGVTSYCCLGLLSELAGCQSHKSTDADFCLLTIPDQEGNFSQSHNWVPLHLADTLGMESSGMVKDRGFRIDRLDATLMSLATANDNGATFAEIADVIERDPSNFFDLRKVKEFGDNF